MVYSNKFVMCVLRNGKPVKELANGTVSIPFGEYSLRFRNKNTDRRALVKFFIDGEEASGPGYIIPANSHIDIERWAEKSVKFKFVSLDSEEAVDFGKNGANPDKVKGTIEARFYLEKERPVQPTAPIHFHHHHYHRPIPNPYPYKYLWGATSISRETKGLKDGLSLGPFDPEQNPVSFSSGCARSAASPSSVQTFSSASLDVSVSSLAGVSAPLQDGCTVEGSHSSQTFSQQYFEAETDYVSVKLFLQGINERPQRKEELSSFGGHPIQDFLDKYESDKNRRIRELEEEKANLSKMIEEKRIRDEKDARIAELEAETKKLREQLGAI